MKYLQKYNPARIFRYLILLIFCFGHSILLGQKKDVSDEYAKYLFRKYNNLPPQNDDPGVFWDYIISCNGEYDSYLVDNSKLATMAKREFYNLLTREREDYDMNAIEKDFALAICGDNFTKYIGGIIYDSLDMSFDVYARVDKKIYLPDGIGYITDNPSKILGVLAHEVAHCTLNHIEIDLYSQKKKEKRNRTGAIFAQILTGVAVGGALITHGASGTFTEETGVQYNELLTNSLTAIDAGFNNNTTKYGYRYSRMQEVESDLVACLFLQWIGDDPLSYVSTLGALKNSYSKYGMVTDDDMTYSTHPSLNFRIKTLMDYLYSAYLYVNSETGEYKIVPQWDEYSLEKTQPEFKRADKKLSRTFIAQNRIYRSRNGYVIIPENERDDYTHERLVQIIIPKKEDMYNSFYYN